MAASTCTFPNADGDALHARLDAPASGTPRAYALFAHCFTCSKDLKAVRRLGRALTDRGIAVLSFDFTGLGRSEGAFAEQTFSHNVDDLVRAAGYLREHHAPPRLLVGHSLGGAAVLCAAARVPEVAAVATIGAPFDPAHVEHLLQDGLDAIRSEGEATVEIGGRPFQVKAEFLEDLAEQRVKEHLAAMDAALLVFHSPVDQTVGIENARRIYEAARHPKSFVSLDGADHLISDERDARYAAGVLAAWADRYLPPAEPSGTVPEGMDANDVLAERYADNRVVATNASGFVTDLAARGFTLRADEPAKVGGTETGPTPYDFLCAALAACTVMTLRMYTDRKGWDPGTVTCTVTHDRVHASDCEACETSEGRVDRLTRTLEASADLTDEQVAKLVEIADKCPVHRSLEREIVVETRVSGPSAGP